MLELNLLGIPELRWEGKSLPLPSPKNLAILSYLALKGESVSRKDLTELFWKDGKASNVRFVLHKLREIPGSETWLETNEHFVSIKAITDVKRFENAMQNERYGEALEFHPHGEVLLKGLELNDAEEFMNWLDLERSRLSQLYLEALQGHITELEKSNKTDEALKLARQLLGQDKLNESTHRAIMRLEHKRGNTEAALAQFETLRNILKEELEVEPLEDTLKLLRDIEGGASSVKNALLLTSATAIPTKPDKLFGREKLLEDVEAYLASKKRVLLHGFGGAGKTALATLIAAKWLEKNKAPVLWLQAGNDDATLLFDALARAFDAQQTLSQSKNAAKAIRDLLIKNKISLFVLDDVWNAYALSKVMEAVPESIPFLVTSRQRYPNLTRVDVGRLERGAALELLFHYAIPPTPLTKGGKNKPPLTGFEVENPQALTDKRLSGFSTSKVSESQSGSANAEDGALEIDSRLSDGGVLVRNVTSSSGDIAKEEPPVLDLRATKSTSSVDAPSPLLGGMKGGDQLCELLGDHAFALRIAGITLAIDELTPEMLLKRIANAPHTLKTPLEFSEAGRESVAALLGASLTALSEEAYEAFMGFGVLFTTSCTAELLALCTRRSEEETEEALIVLQRRGLAERVSEAGSDVITYRLHDLAYSFAKTNNHFRLSTAQRACQVFLGRHQHDFNVLDAEITNLLGATETARGGENNELFVEMMRGLVVGNAYYQARGHSPRSFELLKMAISKTKELGDLESAHYFITKLGNTYREFYGDLDRALQAFKEALELAQQLGNYHREAIILSLIGIVRFSQESNDADKYLEEAYLLAKSHDDGVALSAVLQHRSYVAGHRQDWKQTYHFSKESVEVAEKLREDTSINQAEVTYDLVFGLLNLGEAERKLGRFDEALLSRNRAFQIAQKYENQIWMALALQELGEMYHDVNERRLAQIKYNEALALYWQNNATSKMNALVDFMEAENYTFDERFAGLLPTQSPANALQTPLLYTLSKD